MGGGNDAVYFRGGAPGARFDGGSGTDRFWYYRGSFTSIAVLFNLASGVLRDTWAGGNEQTRHAFRFERTKIYNYGIAAGGITIKGTNGPNRLKAVTGGFHGAAAARIYGRAGDDSLFGSRGDDTLVGGSGDDVATGKSGTDRCDAEAMLNCEEAFRP
jgi:Ca2+-binding RTX toxin-like protein